MSRPEQPAERYPVMPPQSESAGDAPDLRAYLAPIWRWKWVIVAITILAAGVTYALTVHEAKTYTSTARLLVQNADPAASVASSVTAGQTLERADSAGARERRDADHRTGQYRERVSPARRRHGLRGHGRRHSREHLDGH